MCVELVKSEKSRLRSFFSVVMGRWRVREKSLTSEPLSRILELFCITKIWLTFVPNSWEIFFKFLEFFPVTSVSVFPGGSWTTSEFTLTRGLGEVEWRWTGHT